MNFATLYMLTTLHIMELEDWYNIIHNLLFQDHHQMAQRK